MFVFGIFYKWYRAKLQSENDIDHRSNVCDCFTQCGFYGKTMLKKIIRISLQRFKNHYKDEDEKSIHDM